MQEQVTYAEDKICQEAPLPPDLDMQPQPSFHLIHIYCWKLGDTSTCKSQPLSLRTSWCSFRGKPYTGQQLHNRTGEVPHGICELASDRSRWGRPDVWQGQLPAVSSPCERKMLGEEEEGERKREGKRRRMCLLIRALVSSWGFHLITLLSPQDPISKYITLGT